MISAMNKFVKKCDAAKRPTARKNNKINKILNVIYVPVFLHKFLKTLAQTLGSSTMNNERYSKKMTLDS